jgi:hypothetical protein
LKSVLAETSKSANYIGVLRRNVSFEEFTIHIASGRNNSVNEALQSALHFFKALKALVKNQTFIAFFEAELWERAMVLIRGKSEPIAWLQSLVIWGIEKSLVEAGTQIQELTDYFKSSELKVSFALKEALTKSSSIFKRTLRPHQINNVQQLEFEEYTDKYIVELIRELLVHNRIPYWFQVSTSYSVTELLRVLLQQRLVLVRKVVRYTDLMSPQMGSIRGALTLLEFIEVLKNTHVNQRHDLVRLEQLLKSFSRSRFQSFSRAQLEEVCYHVLLKTWMFQEWKSISTSDIWNQIMWGMSYFHNVKNDDLVTDLKKSKKQYPSSFQNSLESAILSFEEEEPIEDLYENEQQEKMETSRTMTDHIPINNAGLVIFNTYIPMLFDRLGLTEDNKFISPKDQMKAVHYLQYLVTGLENMDEMYLTLNKVLCGMHPTVPLTATVEITEDEKKLMDGLIQALINSWTAIGVSDVDGFRGNWLVRDGILTDTETSWVLTVDSKVYDVLLNKTPFSFSMLKFPWTRKPIRVEWDY